MSNAGKNLWSLVDSQMVKMYDKYGRNQGYLRKRGHEIWIHDKGGANQGHFTQNGNTMSQYDKGGNYQGYFKK